MFKLDNLLYSDIYILFINVIQGSYEHSPVSLSNRKSTPAMCIQVVGQSFSHNYQIGLDHWTTVAMCLMKKCGPSTSIASLGWVSMSIVDSLDSR